jgi:LytS/YehU family sensor histidine kinase
VSALIHSNPNAAVETLVLVSDMLRHAVDTSRVQEVPLRAELATLGLYTQIQQVRFGDRLCLSWNVAEETLDAAVPHMLLQPLVENAIKHGVETHSNAGKIVISSWKDGNALWMSIQDDGPGYSVPSPRRGAGLGIANVRSRLKQLYGAEMRMAGSWAWSLTIQTLTWRTRLSPSQVCQPLDEDEGMVATTRSVACGDVLELT